MDTERDSAAAPRRRSGAGKTVAIGALMALVALGVASASLKATAGYGSGGETAVLVAADGDGGYRPEAPQSGLRTVVLDPGHGGSEIGAVGPSGLTEKEVVLDIAKRLRDLLSGRLGLQVELTRESDVNKPLEDRTAQANWLKADVFVSIHANSYRGRSVHGAETFFLSDRATDDDARRVAALENDALGLQAPAAGDSELQLLLWDMAQTAHLQESSALADFIQQELNSLSGTTDRGIKQAPFRVLKGADMPAVLVEVGFISNPDEERLLADPSHRQRIAESLYESLNRYRRRQSMLGGSQR